MTKPDLEASADALKALAHPVRLAILNTLSQGERSVGEIETVSGIGQPALSQQLAVLRNAALVLTRRKAKLVFYRINQAQVADISAVLKGLTNDDGARRANDSTHARQHGRGAAAFARILQPQD